MHTINSKKLALALGLTSVVFYLSCIGIMLIAGKKGTTWFFNSILHGLDVSTITKMHVPVGQTIMGLVLTFILGGLVGGLTGEVYNWSKN